MHALKTRRKISWGRQQLPMIGRPAQNRAFETMMVFPAWPEVHVRSARGAARSEAWSSNREGRYAMRPRPASDEPRR
jgi:hypothetical protein